jgi:hypothetical protein
MATIIEPNDREVVREVHHDHYVNDADSGVGTLVGVILAIILIAILLFYGLPLFRRAANRSNEPNTINVNLNGSVPQPNSGSPAGTTP